MHLRFFNVCPQAQIHTHTMIVNRSLLQCRDTYSHNFISLSQPSAQDFSPRLQPILCFYQVIFRAAMALTEKLMQLLADYHRCP